MQNLRLQEPCQGGIILLTKIFSTYSFTIHLTDSQFKYNQVFYTYTISIKDKQTDIPRT